MKVAVQLAGCDGLQDVVLEGLNQDQVNVLRALASVTGDGGCTPGFLLAETHEEAREEYITWNMPEQPYEPWEGDPVQVTL